MPFMPGLNLSRDVFISSIRLLGGLWRVHGENLDCELVESYRG
jgi:hypothetical protein